MKPHYIFFGLIVCGLLILSGCAPQQPQEYQIPASECTHMMSDVAEKTAELLVAKCKAAINEVKLACINSQLPTPMTPETETTAASRFQKGMRVCMTDEALRHFNLKEKQNGYCGATPHPGGPNVGVIRDGTSTIQYYHQSFWEPA